jgi:hypothetical protein
VTTLHTSRPLTDTRPSSELAGRKVVNLKTGYYRTVSIPFEQQKATESLDRKLHDTRRFVLS